MASTGGGKVSEGAAAVMSASRACVRGVVVAVTAADDDDVEGVPAPLLLDGVPGRTYGTSGGISVGSARGGTAATRPRLERAAEAGEAATALGAFSTGSAAAAPRLRFWPETDGDCVDAAVAAGLAAEPAAGALAAAAASGSGARGGGEQHADATARRNDGNETPAAMSARAHDCSQSSCPVLPLVPKASPISGSGMVAASIVAVVS